MPVTFGKWPAFFLYIVYRSSDLSLIILPNRATKGLAAAMPKGTPILLAWLGAVTAAPPPMPPPKRTPDAAWAVAAWPPAEPPTAW